MLNALLPQVNVDPEDLIPKLPRPRDLQPFPVCQALVSVESEVGKCPQVSCVSVFSLFLFYRSTGATATLSVASLSPQGASG